MNCIITRSGGGSSSRMPQFTYTGQYEFITEDEAAKSWKLKFLSSGVFTLLSPRELDIDLFLVGGGGAGSGVCRGGAGGGGGGGYTATHKNIPIKKNTPYPITVGGGGMANTTMGTAGGASSGFDYSIGGGQPATNGYDEKGSSYWRYYAGAGGAGGSGGGGGGSLLACGGFFHGSRHQRVQVFFLHRFAGNADPAVLVRFTAHGHRVFRADPHRHHRLIRGGQGGGLEHRHLRLHGLCRCSHRGFRGRRRHGGVHHRGRSRRSGGREEILGGSLHGIRHHRFDDGPGRGLLERVLPKGAGRPDDDGLNGLAAALGNRGIRPKAL